MVGDRIGADVLAGGGFRIGTVLSKSLGLLWRNIVLLTALAGMAFAVEFLIAAMSGDVDYETDEVNAALRAMLQEHLANAIVSTLSTAIILYLVLHQMIGRPVRVREALAATLSRLAPLLGVALLYRLALIGPFVLLFATSTLLLVIPMTDIYVSVLILMTPGLILLVLWYVAIPVCVMERRGLFQSLRRSSALTKGARFKLLAFLILEFALNYIGGTLIPDAVGAFAGYWGQTAVQFALSSLQYAFTGVLTAVIYYELLTEKQGFEPERIAAIFD
jgi:hypothetical protein